MFIPFAWSVITSFKTLPDSVSLTFIPHPFTTAGWDYALTKLNPPLPVLFLNSAIIAVAVTITNLVLGSIAGYAFARLRFPGREVLFLLVLGTLMIPDQLRLVPIYVMFNDARPDQRHRPVRRASSWSWPSRRRASSCCASTSCRSRASSRRPPGSTARASSRRSGG